MGCLVPASIDSSFTKSLEYIPIFPFPLSLSGIKHFYFVCHVLRCLLIFLSLMIYVLQPMPYDIRIGVLFLLVPSALHDSPADTL